MKPIKKIIIQIVAIAMLLSISFVSSSATSKVSVAVDGNWLSITPDYGTAYIDTANRTMVPIRVLAENLDAKVEWDQNSQTAIINDTIKIKLGSSVIQTRYGTIAMDTKAILKNNRLYVPVRYIGNALGYDVDAHIKDGVIVANITSKVDLNIYAASSLKGALTAIKTTYSEEKPNANVNINFGASGVLQQQIEQGADVDMFFPDSTENIDKLKEKGLLNNDSISNIVKNKLVLIVPKDSTTDISGFSKVTNTSIRNIAIGDASKVPVGMYAEQAFAFYDILDDVKTKAIYGSDVKEVLNYVITGNADAGVVYSSDAITTSDVKVIATAVEHSHNGIIYPAAILKTTQNPVATQGFINYLSSDTAKELFLMYGFIVK